MAIRSMRATWMVPAFATALLFGCEVNEANRDVSDANALVRASNTLSWKGHTWNVTTGGMAGVANGSANNVSIDSNGYLHLKITNSGGTWTAAELFTTDKLGFGTYQWQIDGPIDRFDKNVVLGLFPYGPAAGIGSDGTNEIDIEYGFWGYPNGTNGSYTDYPASGSTIGNHNFNFSLNGGTFSTSRFVWSAKSIASSLMTDFQAPGSSAGLLQGWTYAPSNPATNIPQQALPLGMNLWCFEATPSNGQNVEVVIRDFQFIPEGTPTPTPTPTPTSTSTLPAGASLNGGQSLTSPDGLSQAIMQTDGNFGLYQLGVWAWGTMTNGSGAQRISMQTDGNLVIYDANNNPKWASGTMDSGATTLTLQNDGNLVLYRADGGAVWASNTNRNLGSQGSNLTLSANYRLTSPDGRMEAVMRPDGNFVVYFGSSALWSTGTQGSGANHTVMQSDGNLVVYDANNNPKWASGTNGKSGAVLEMQSDGNLVIYDSSGAAVWATGTYGH